MVELRGGELEAAAAKYCAVSQRDCLVPSVYRGEDGLWPYRVDGGFTGENRQHTS